MQFNTSDGPLAVRVDQLTIAGWTGRDADAVQHHIDELAAIGVSPPSQVPLFYQVSNTLLTSAAEIQVLGDTSSGEAEPMVVHHAGRRWLGLASDHTDRALEATSVAASKQACQKPCATGLWDFDAVSGYLDEISIRSWIWERDAWVLYQDGTLAQIRPLPELMDLARMSPQSAMLCGTLPAIGGVRASDRFRAVLADPVTGLTLDMEYDATPLPVVQ